MRISRITIRNFRNFRFLDVCLGEHAIIVGENKIGKSNLLHALRLVLDPSLADSSRYLRMEDFWDGLRPLTREHAIQISVEFTEFAKNERVGCHLWPALVDPDSETARLTYAFEPRPDLDGHPRRESDYHYRFYGGKDPEKAIKGELRHRIALDVLPALRDAEDALANWRYSPLRPLIEDACATINHGDLETVAAQFTALSDTLAEGPELRQLATAINDRLSRMVGTVHGLEMSIGLSSTDPERLLRAVRLFIDGRRRSVAEASLGAANLLYITLKQLALEQSIRHGARDHTILAIEEPEAHLHPHLQRLVYRDYLRPRTHLPTQTFSDADADRPQGPDLSSESITKLVTTHSPHIISVSPIRSLVHLRRDRGNGSTIAVSTHNLQLTTEDEADLERYLDVTRGEIVFARGVILVEGEAEMYLVPKFAKLLGYDFDELGISVCSVGGTNFAPYLKLLGPMGLDVPHAVLTDADPDSDEPSRGRIRIGRLFPLIYRPGEPPRSDLVEPTSPTFLSEAAARGMFLNDHTLEVDVFRCGQHASVVETLIELTTSEQCRERAASWATEPERVDVRHLIADISKIGKGRFAQRLSTAIHDPACPRYISDAIEYTARLCR